MSENIISRIIGIDFDLYGSDEVLRSSVIDGEGIVYPDTYDNSEPKIGGLIDPRLGVTDQFMRCATCKCNYLKCQGHFGHLKLVEPMFHFGLMQYTKNTLSCICFKTCKLLISSEVLSKKIISKTNKNRFTEIKKLCSAVKYSPYSGAPQPSLKVEIKKNQGLIYIIAEYNVSINDELDLPGTNAGEVIVDNKKKITQILTAADCYHLLKNISDEDCEILGIERPEKMILTIFPVPPVAIRPSVRGDFTNQGYSEHGTTHKLVDIVKFNLKLKKEKEKSISTNDNSKYRKDYQDCLQYHLATYFDNESMVLPRSELKSGGNSAKSITFRFKGGKTGRIRGNLQGKRVDYSARTVITSDPNNNLDELGVPLKVARTITFPEIVTPYNIEHLTKLIRNGRDKYPGANYVENIHVLGNNGKPVKIDLKYKNYDLLLQYGWIVHRHLVDGDVVLFNRQPSLHKMSMMAHKVKVIQNINYITFRLNVTATTPYNADFDGDEMNLFAPQSEQARVELMMLADIKNHIISPKDSKPIVNLKQDALLGSYKFTSDENVMSWKETMNMLAYTSIVNKLISGEEKIEKRDYPGREVFSFLIPKKVNSTNSNTVIKNGMIEKGILSKSELAGSKNSIIHLIIDSYDKHMAAQFMDDVQRLTNSWLMKIYGFTVGLGDAIIDPAIVQEVEAYNKKKIMEIYNLITQVENDHYFERKSFEEIVFRELNNIMSYQAKTIMSKLDIKNNFFVQIKSGSKGKDVNVGQIIGVVGQSTFEGKLMQKKLNKRTLPHVAKQDDSAQARGFISDPFISGVKATEFFYHNMDGRSGMIDTAIKTADTGYMQRKTIKATEDVYQAYDSTVRNSSNGIVQLIYGDSAFDTSNQMQLKSKLILMDNKEVAEKYLFTKDECKKFKINTKWNDSFYQTIIETRDHLRYIQRRATCDSKIIVDTFHLPFNLSRVISYYTNQQKVNKDTPTPDEILSAIEIWLDYKNTRLIACKNTDTIKIRNQTTHKTLLRLLLLEYLAPRRIMVEYGLSKKTFNLLLEDLLRSFNMNIVQPCEMVGILAAQSIGEPLTQFTLNTFHGTSDVVTNMSAMGRFKELISFTKSIKNPFMKIYLTEDIKYNETKARMLANMIENTMFKDIVLGTEIYFERNYKDKMSIHNRDKMDDNSKNIFFVSSSLKNVSLISLPWVFRFILNKEMMWEKNVTLLMIKTQFMNFWNSTYVDLKGFRKKEKGIVAFVNNLCILSNDESDDTLIVHIRFDFNDYNYPQIIDILNVVINTFKVKGLQGIEKVYCDKELEKTFDKETGKVIETYEYVITSKGTNLSDIYFLDGVDNTRTITNDVYNISNLFGIEATRNLLFKEINSIFSNQGQDINYQHVAILVDIMVQTGTVTPVNRYGINKLDTDPLSRASFEKTIEQLIQAAVFQEKDKISSVSSRIIAGRVINGGTGMMDILIDTKKLENTEFVEDRYLMDISNINVTELTADPLLDEMFKN